MTPETSAPAGPAGRDGRGACRRAPAGAAVRQYSLCGDPADRSRYRIAVQREDGRAGRLALAARAPAAGAMLIVSAPRNHFELERGGALPAARWPGSASRPILAMAHALRAEGRPFVLHVFARSREAAPLLDEIEDAAGAERLSLHLSDEPATRLDLADLLAAPEPGTADLLLRPAALHGRLCGRAARHGPRTASASRPSPALRRRLRARALRDRRASRGATLPVPAGRSALEVLRESSASTSRPPARSASAAPANAASSRAGRSTATSCSRRARGGPLHPCVSRAAGTLRARPVSADRDLTRAGQPAEARAEPGGPSRKGGPRGDSNQQTLLAERPAIRPRCGGW